MNTELSLWTDTKSLAEIRQNFAPRLSDTEFALLVQMGKATRLNPFLREIWSVKYSTDQPAQIFIGRDGYRKGAQAHPDYEGHSAYTICENDVMQIIDGVVKHEMNFGNRGKLVGAFCIVKRKNCMPIFVDVKLNEYDTKKSLWATKPETMLKKVAEAQALRMAFQETFAGSYCEAELPDKTSNRHKGEVIQHEDTAITKQQLEIINALIADKAIPEDRINNALSYFGVATFAELEYNQAAQVIRVLGK